MLTVVQATGRASHARQVKGDDPDKKGYPGPPGWGFGVGLSTPVRERSTFPMLFRRSQFEENLSCTGRGFVT
jgi:hypothetical protein